MHWSYHSLALSHWYIAFLSRIQCKVKYYEVSNWYHKRLKHCWPLTKTKFFLTPMQYMSSDWHLTLLVLKLKYSGENQVNTMAADVLAPCVTSLIAAMALNMPNTWVFVFYREGFQLNVLSQCWLMMKCQNLLLFPKINSAQDLSINQQHLSLECCKFTVGIHSKPPLVTVGSFPSNKAPTPSPSQCSHSPHKPWPQSCPNVYWSTVINISLVNISHGWHITAASIQWYVSHVSPSHFPISKA